MEAEPAAISINVCILILGSSVEEGPERPVFTRGPDSRKSVAFSGSNQARKGRLVDALAVRGDERRDTLR